MCPRQVFFTNLTGTKFGTGKKITGTGKKMTGTGKKMSGVDVPSARVHEPSKGVVEISPLPRISCCVALLFNHVMR